MSSKPSYAIKIDHGKCTDAANCLICINTCPSGVFTAYPVKEHFLTEGAEWRVSAGFTSLCTGCGACRRDCPKGAVGISGFGQTGQGG